MRSLHIRSIQMKIALWAGLCLTLISIILIGFAVVRLRSQATAAAEEQALAVAQAESRAIKAEVELALDAARTMAQALTAVKSQGIELTRDDVNGMLKQLTVDNPNFVGTWTIWEPNAFDGRDAEYVGQAPYDETGRFTAYWNRNRQGNVQVETPVGYETEDFYQLPKKNREETITDPYLYPVQGREVLMTSVVVPVMVDGRFYGVAGVDIGLEFLQNVADALDAYDGMAELALISYNGTLAGVTDRPDLIGEHMESLHEDWQEDIEYVQNGQEIYETDEGRIAVFVPIQFGHADTPWSVNLNVPTAQINAQATAAMWQMIGIGIVMALGVLAILWFAAGQIARPIQRITHIAQIIAEGDLEQDVDISSRDEIGQLADAFRRMNNYLQEMAYAAQQIAEGDLTSSVMPRSERDALGQAFDQMIANLRQLLVQVTDNANTVSAASGQLTATANQSAQATNQVAATMQQIAQGTAQQTQSVTEATNIVEQVSRAIDGVARGAQEQAVAVGRSAEITGRISGIVQQVTVNAQAGAQGAAGAAQAARDGAQAVKRTVKGMESIKSSTDIVAQRITEMGRQSEQIGVIVETIDDIASQTNLLALNAAIEAARAGEHGKGFAVVADEVRKLAESATQSTNEVAGLIKDVQKTISEAVQAMDTGTVEVEAGLVQAHEAGRVLENILDAAEGVSHQVEEIAVAAQQVETSMDDMVSAIDAVSAVVEENTASTEEMSASAGQVTNAMENVASISEENSAASEEVSATVEEVSAQVEEVTASAQSLSELAEALTVTIANFKLAKGQGAIMQIELFKQAHLRWVDRLNNMLAGKARFQASEIENHITCILGQWYYQRGQIDFGHLPEFIQLEEPHIRMHKAVVDAVTAHNQGDQKAAQAATRTAKQLSHDIVELLDRLERRIETTVVDPGGASRRGRDAQPGGDGRRTERVTSL